MAEKNTPREHGLAGAVDEIPLDLIGWAPQPRTTFDEPSLEELIESLKLRKLLCPIRVRPTAGGRYEGVCGERRYRAAQRLRWPTITAVVASGELTEAERTLDQLTENQFRDGLQPVEKARAYRRVMEGQGWNERQLAESLGLSPGKVCQDLRLLDLPADVQADVDAGLIPASSGYEIAKAPTERQPDLARQVKEKKLSRDQVRKATARNAEKPDDKADDKPNSSGPFEATIEQGKYRFVVTGNKVVIGGTKVDGYPDLGVAVGQLVLWFHTHHPHLLKPPTATKSPDRKPDRNAGAAGRPATPTKAIAPPSHEDRPVETVPTTPSEVLS